MRKKLSGNAAIMAVLSVTWQELRALPLKDWLELEAMAVAALAKGAPTNIVAKAA